MNKKFLHTCMNKSNLSQIIEGQPVTTQNAIQLFIVKLYTLTLKEFYFILSNKYKHIS